MERSVTRHPIGINQRQETDDTRALSYLQQMGGCRAWLCHFDNGALARMHRYKQWVDILIWRPRDDDQRYLFRTFPDPEQYIRNCRAQLLARGFQADDLWLYLHNEATWGLSMLDWEYKAALAATSVGMKVVALNPSVGTPNEDEVYMAEKVLRLAADKPDQVLVGCHEYFSVYGHRKKDWYLGRWKTEAFQQNGHGHSFETFRKSKVIGPVRYLISEFGADNIADDAEYARQFLVGGHIPRGVHQLDNAWSRTYNDKEHNPNPKKYPGLDEAYFEQIEVAFETGSYADDAVEAVLVFGWGPEWPDFDVSRMTVLHRLLAAWWQRNQPSVPIEPKPEPTPTPTPIPEPKPEPEPPAKPEPDDEDDTQEKLPYPTKAEFDALKAEVQEMKDALEQSKAEYDKLLMGIMQVIGAQINQHQLDTIKLGANTS